MIDGYDSTIISNIPRDAGAVVCYMDLRYKNDGEARAQFAHLEAQGRIVPLTAAFNDAVGIDIEPGNAPPRVAGAWYWQQHARGRFRPVIYADLSDMRQVISALHLAGVPTPPPGPARPTRLYSAHPTGVRHICGPNTCGFPVEMDATQWWWSSLHNPGGPDLDKDVFREDFFTPTLQPPLTPEEQIVSLVSYQTADHRVGFAKETSKGEVLHIEQQNPSGVQGQNSDFWRKADGSANWLSLGRPGE